MINYIIDIIASRGVKLRGQAWVAFEDISSATNALRGSNINILLLILKLIYIYYRETRI